MDNLSNKKKLIGIVLVLLLVAVIPLSIYLVKHQQSTKSKASFSGTGAEFEDAAGNKLGTTSNQNIFLKVQYDPNNTGGSTGGGGGTTTSGSDSCNFSGLGSSAGPGSTTFTVTATKSNASYLLGIWLLNNDFGTTQTNYTNQLSYPVYINFGQYYQSVNTATVECRIQTDSSGSTVIARNTMTVHINR